jgi:ribosomal protein S18 acetylase RimI-like enzyme
MVSKQDGPVIIEIAKKEAYLREIVSNYRKSHYYDASVRHKLGFWSIQLNLKAFDKVLDKEYHWKLFEDHIEESRVFAGLLNSREVGWIELGYDKWNNRMRVWEFLVKQEFRRRGVGTRLMNHAVNIARERGARMLVLETQSNNASAIDFYLNFGFRSIGLDVAAYSNKDIDKKEVRLELGLELQ